MNFDFYQAGCNTFLDPTPKILLSFDYYDPQTCHS